MQLNEIKVGGIYLTTLNVQFRNEREIREVDFFIRVSGKNEKCLEVRFLNDNAIYHLEPHQLRPVE